MVGDKKQMHHNKPNRMSVTEIMVALSIATRICVQTSKTLFPSLVSYNRFIELEKKLLLPLTMFIRKNPVGNLYRYQLH